MKLLLDTHILLWLMQDAPQLTATARRLIEQADSLHLSSVSLWEVAIKRSLGKLRLDMDTLDAHLAASGIRPLAVTWAHARHLRALPLHHGDPFDRLMISQAMNRELTIISRDTAFHAYGVPLLW